jgi:hypothetical protein
MAKHLGLLRLAPSGLEFCGRDELPSIFHVSDLAAGAIGAAALAVSELARQSRILLPFGRIRGSSGKPQLNT